MRLVLRRANPTAGPSLDRLVDAAWGHFDQGTQRAILRLYRSAPEETLAAAGEGLGELASPALILWGERDPFIGPQFAQAYGRALPNGQCVRVPGAGHWPWLDRPEVVEQVTDFLAAG